MKQQIRHLAKDTLVYGVGSAAQKFIGLFMFPIYTRLLSKGEFGIQDLMGISLTIISQVIILGMDSGASRYYYDAGDSRSQKIVLSTWLWTQLVLGLAMTALLLLFAPLICRILFRDASLQIYFRLTAANLPLVQFLSLSYLVLRLRFESKAYSVIIVSGLFIQAISCILFVAVLRMGIVGVFYGQLVGNIVKSAIALVATRGAYTLAHDRGMLQRMLAFGLPFVPATISLWLLNYSNRVFLVHFYTLNEIGILSAAMRVGSIVVFLITAFRTAWGPFAFSIAKERETSRETYSAVLTYYLLFTSMATIVISLFAREIIMVFATPAYLNAASMVSYFCVSAILWGATYVVGMGFQIEKKTYHVTALTALGAAINIGMNFLLIPKYGVEGAAISALTGNGCALVYSYVAGRRYMKLRYDVRAVTLILILMVAVIWAGRFADGRNTDWSLPLLAAKLGFLSVFILSSFFLFKKEWLRLSSTMLAKAFSRT